MITLSSALTDIAFPMGLGVLFSTFLPEGIIMAFGRAWSIVSEAYHFSGIYINFAYFMNSDIPSFS